MKIAINKGIKRLIFAYKMHVVEFIYRIYEHNCLMTNVQCSYCSYDTKKSDRSRCKKIIYTWGPLENVNQIIYCNSNKADVGTTHKKPLSSKINQNEMKRKCHMTFGFF